MASFTIDCGQSLPDSWSNNLNNGNFSDRFGDGGKDASIDKSSSGLISDFSVTAADFHSAGITDAAGETPNLAGTADVLQLDTTAPTISSETGDVGNHLSDLNTTSFFNAETNSTVNLDDISAPVGSDATSYSATTELSTTISMGATGTTFDFTNFLDSEHFFGTQNSFIANAPVATGSLLTASVMDPVITPSHLTAPASAVLGESLTAASPFVGATNFGEVHSAGQATPSGPVAVANTSQASAGGLTINVVTIRAPAACQLGS